jgi:predicted nucleic acid-binding protein
VSDRLARGLLDTSMVVDLDLLAADQLPEEVAISAISLAELSAGPSAAGAPEERARRQDRLQRTEAVFDPLPFGVEAARAYGASTPRWWSRAARHGVAWLTCSSPRPPWLSSCH